MGARAAAFPFSLMQRYVRPLAAVVFFEAADLVEFEDFATQVIEMVFGIADLVADGLPLLTQLVEEDVELGILDIGEPEFRFEMFDAEVDDFVLRGNEVLVNDVRIMPRLGRVGMIFPHAIARPHHGRQRAISPRQRLPDAHNVGELPAPALPAVDEQNRSRNLPDADGGLDGDAKEETRGRAHAPLSYRRDGVAGLIESP